MLWTKEKIYLIILITALILSIITILYLNRKDSHKSSSESYKIRNKKILVLYTGGTFGMSNSKDGLVHIPGLFKNKLTKTTKKFKPIPQVDIIEYNPPLKSENIKPKDWVRIGSDISKVYNKYDAFIVIHGMDNMTYTASALSFMLENLNKTVVITGSVPDVHEEEKNLLNSLYVASSFEIPEVVICFNNNILRGCTSIKTKHDFVSPKYPLLGKTLKNSKLNKKLCLQPPKEAFHFTAINPKKRVVVVKLFPGINARYLMGILQGGPIDGIILESGNDVPTDLTFIKKIKRMVNEGIVIVNLSEKSLEKIGVISGKDMTTEAALTKVYFLVSNLKNYNYKIVSKLIKYNMRGEIN